MKNQPTGILLREVARTLLQLQRAQVACCSGTTSTQCFILGEVGRSGPVTLAELGRRLALDKGWVSRAVDSLERERLLFKLPSKADRRTVTVSLSPAGERRFSELNRALNEQSDGVLARIPNSDRPGVYRALRQLHEALQAEVVFAASAKAGRAGCAPASALPAMAAKPKRRRNHRR